MTFAKELQAYARSKPGVEASIPSEWTNFEDYCGEVRLIGRYSCFHYRDFLDPKCYSVLMSRTQFDVHRAVFPSIFHRETACDTPEYIVVSVPVDAPIPLDYLQELIDDSYQLAFACLTPREAIRFELATQKYVEEEFLNRLIDVHELTQHRDFIVSLAQKAVLLRSRKSVDQELELGASKIGGFPDLPKSVEWPRFNDRRPLAFLLQLNLDDVSNCESSAHGLPKTGNLLVFSPWGWFEEGDGFPNLPHFEKTQADHGVFIHVDRSEELERRDPPEGVHLFDAAEIEFTPIDSLPSDPEEHTLIERALSESERKRYSSLEDDFRSLQMYHWHQRSSATCHYIGGYSRGTWMKYELPSYLTQTNLHRIVTLGSDYNAHMGWGDDHELSFFCDSDALKQGRFERIWAFCHG
jgi:uncharacterized protein YwqG